MRASTGAAGRVAKENGLELPRRYAALLQGEVLTGHRRHVVGRGCRPLSLPWNRRDRRHSDDGSYGIGRGGGASTSDYAMLQGLLRQEQAHIQSQVGGSLAAGAQKSRTTPGSPAVIASGAAASSSAAWRDGGADAQSTVGAGRASVGAMAPCATVHLVAASPAQSARARASFAPREGSPHMARRRSNAEGVASDDRRPVDNDGWPSVVRLYVRSTICVHGCELAARRVSALAVLRYGRRLLEVCSMPR